MSKQAFKKWYYDLKPTDCGVLVDELIWQYFAPHLRGDFPREAVLKILLEQDMTIVCNDIERLWNAPKNLPTFKDVYGILGASVCETCGDSGERCDCMGDWCYKRDPEYCDRCLQPDWKPCPDCTEQPICLRCGWNKAATDDYLCPPGSASEHRFVDQRKGQRRTRQEKDWPPGYGRRIKGSDADRRFKTTRRRSDFDKYPKLPQFPYGECKYIPLGRRGEGKSRRKGGSTRREGDRRK